MQINLLKVLRVICCTWILHYNSRQYCDAHHLLENVARWEKLEVYGVARKMDRTSLKSDYCMITATKAFEELVEKDDIQYILILCLVIMKKYYVTLLKEKNR